MEKENLKQHDKRKERRKVDDFLFFGDWEGTGINARMENSTWSKRDILIKMEKKGNLGNELGKVMSVFEQIRLKVKISYT